MPNKISKIEFARLCGVQNNFLNVYIVRKKVLMDRNRMIDIEHPLNKEFMDIKIAEMKAKGLEPAPPKVPKPKVKPAPKPKPVKEKKVKAVKAVKPAKVKAVKEVVEEENEEVVVAAEPKPKRKPALHLNKMAPPSDEMYQMQFAKETQKYNVEIQKRELELKKTEQEVELNRLKIAKLSGEVIPTDLVKVVFGQHFKSVTTAFHQGADNFISTIAKRAGMDRKDMAVMRNELIEVVNKAVKDAINDSKDSIDHIVGEYQQKRGVGEKK
jgi:hypothetical protein